VHSYGIPQLARALQLSYRSLRRLISECDTEPDSLLAIQRERRGEASGSAQQAADKEGLHSYGERFG
jgi:Sec-independent protein translocase protein TatA